MIGFQNPFFHEIYLLNAIRNYCHNFKLNIFHLEIQAGINATDFINATTIQDCIEACKTELECGSYLIEANGETLVSCQLMEEVPDGAASETILQNGDTNFFWGSKGCLKVNISTIKYLLI